MAGAVLTRFAGALAAVAAFACLACLCPETRSQGEGPRQYYTAWQKHDERGYYYCRHCYKCCCADADYAYHYLIYYPGRPNHVYCYDPEHKVYYGCWEVQPATAGQPGAPAQAGAPGQPGGPAQPGAPPQPGAPGQPGAAPPPVTPGQPGAAPGQPGAPPPTPGQPPAAPLPGAAPAAGQPQVAFRPLPPAEQKASVDAINPAALGQPGAAPVLPGATDGVQAIPPAIADLPKIAPPPNPQGT